MFGWDVAVLQFMLARRGALVPVYGYFDGATERAVRRYQRARRLASDGIAGKMTLTALGYGRPALTLVKRTVPVPPLGVRALRRSRARGGCRRAGEGT